MRVKLCPILLRERDDQTQFLCFKHPLAGMQIVKGSLETEKTAEYGALREMKEESG